MKSSVALNVIFQAISYAQWNTEILITSILTPKAHYTQLTFFS